MPKQTKSPSYAELTAQVVREAAHPIPLDEIMRRVHALRPIETRSPAGTIRSAIAQNRLIAPDGKGKYGLSARMMQGARVRVPLRGLDGEHAPAWIEIGDDARELLWPAFFAIQKYHDVEPIHLALPSGKTTALPLDFLGTGMWGTRGTPDFWHWLQTTHARSGDDLIFEAIDAEARRYRVEHVPASTRDDAAVEARSIELIETGLQLLQSARSKSVSSIWDMARMLLVKGDYKHPTPPAPIEDLWPAMLRRLNGEKPSKGDVVQLKITLEGTQPAIWRRVQVPVSWTLGALHYVLQFAMGWTNSHLHHFIIGNGDQAKPAYYSLYADMDELGETVDSAGVKLSAVLPPVKGRFRYEYDFGDSWLHRIEVERILLADDHKQYPWCLDGERACPPEDCGGVSGFAHLLKIMRNPKHPEFMDMLDWLKGMYIFGYEPLRFERMKVNLDLGKVDPKRLDAERYVPVFSAQML